MPVDGVETEPAHSASERIEAAPHVQWLDRDEDAYRRRKAQHDLSTPTRRRSTSSSKCPPTSSSTPPTRTTRGL